MELVSNYMGDKLRKKYVGAWQNITTESKYPLAVSIVLKATGVSALMCAYNNQKLKDVGITNANYKYEHPNDFLINTAKKIIKFEERFNSLPSDELAAHFLEAERG